MRYLLFAFALAAALVPAAAAAQATPPPGGPPPDRAKLEEFRAVARVNALKNLSVDHQAKIQAIVSAVGAGTLPLRDGAKQIDAILTPDESKAILAQEQQIRETMMAMRGGANPNPPPPGAPPGQGPGQGAQPNAGRFLLRLLLTPQQMRALRDQQPKQQ
jgi:hypothetical protein